MSCTTNFHELTHFKTMKKLQFSESQEYSSLNKLGPVQKILTQSQNSWEE